MRIEDLKIFVDVVRYHSMSIAAEKNFTTPQNLSKIIKRMEDDLDVKLFKRSRKGSDLTLEGEKFYLNIVQVLRLYEDALIAATGINCLKNTCQNEHINTMEINVLISQGVFSYAIMEAYNEVKKRWGNIVLIEDEVSLYSSSEFIDYMIDKSPDIIACILKKDEVDDLSKKLEDYILMHVLSDEMVLIVGKDNYLGNRYMVTPEDIKQLNVISLKNNPMYDSILDSGFSYQMQISSVSKALTLVRESDSYCILMSRCFFKLVNNKTNDLRMIRLNKTILGTYVVYLKKECVHDEIMMDFVMKIAEIFYDSIESN